MKPSMKFSNCTNAAFLLRLDTIWIYIYIYIFREKLGFKMLVISIKTRMKFLFLKTEILLPWCSRGMRHSVPTTAIITFSEEIKGLLKTFL